MNWSDLKDIAAKASPVLGTLIAGPAGAQVGALISGVLGSDNNPEAIAQALADPEKAVQLKKWAYEHKERLAQIGLDTLRAELGDKANAREHHKHSKMPAIICMVLIIVTAAAGAALMFVTVPAGNIPTVYLIVGQLLGWTGAAIAYWVGTTRSSAEKDRRKPL